MSEERLSFLDVLNPVNIEARYPPQRFRQLEALAVERCGKMIQKPEMLYL